MIPQLLEAPRLELCQLNLEFEYEQAKPQDSFRMMIKELVKVLESDCHSVKSINSLCEQFNFKRRRLYDVLNVLEAIGCCKKTNSDRVSWQGMDRIVPTLRNMVISSKSNNNQTSLTDLFSIDKCVCMSSLTQQLLLCFLSLNVDSIDLKEAAAFLSRDERKYKTTVCKLYQITHILEAVGVIAKQMTPSVITLDPKFRLENLCDFSVEFLLNRKMPVYEKRSQEFKQLISAL